MDISEAISHKRIHHQWIPDTTYLEEVVFSNDSQKVYEDIGHKTRTTRYMGSIMGILIDKKNNTLYGTADPRSPDGLAVGY